MYLSKRTITKNYSKQADRNYEVKAFLNGSPISHVSPERIILVEEDVMYWNGADMIHNWFVQNVQQGKDDHGTHFLDKSKLEELAYTCRMVMEAFMREPNKHFMEIDEARNLMPSSALLSKTKESDMRYLAYVRDTYEGITGLIKEIEDANDGTVVEFVYHAS